MQDQGLDALNRALTDWRDVRDRTTEMERATQVARDEAQVRFAVLATVARHLDIETPNVDGEYHTFDRAVAVLIAAGYHDDPLTGSHPGDDDYAFAEAWVEQRGSREARVERLLDQ